MPDTWTGLRLAAGTLTVIPVGELPMVTPPVGRRAMLLAPVAAIPLGVLAGGVVALGERVDLPSLVTAALLLVALGWATRGMHWDGLADTADGLAAGWDRERALAVMRRGDAGPVAVGVLGLVLLLDAAALSAVTDRPDSAVLVGAVVACSRVACALTASTLLPAARHDGLGVVVAGTVPIVGSALSTIVVAGILAAVSHGSGLPWWQGPVAVAVALGVVVLLLRRCHRVLGGVTGDVMGAGIEVALCGLLVVLSGGGLG